MKRHAQITMYEIIETKGWNEDSATYQTFGIMCTFAGVDGERGAIKIIPDISTDRDLVSSMVWFFNMSRMSADYFMEVVVGVIS